MIALCKILLTVCFSLQLALLGMHRTSVTLRPVSGEAENSDTCLKGGRTHADPLKKRIIELMRRDSLTEALACAREIARIAEREGSESDLIFAYNYIAQSLLFLGRYDSLPYYLTGALDLSLRRNDVWGIAYACNGLGIYAVNVERDYYKAVSYFQNGVKITENYPDRSLYYTLQGNLAMAYYRRRDPAGLRYAGEVYRYGRRVNDSSMVFTGSFVSAAMHYLLEEYPAALKYITQTVSLVNGYYDRTGVYGLYGDILHALGRDDEALACYQTAFDHIAEAETTSAIDLHASYGEFFISRNRYNEAIQVLRKGLALAAETGNTVGRYRLYGDLATCYNRSGNYCDALKWYTLYHEESDSVFNVERERSINELTVRYQTEKKEKEIQEKELELLRGRKRMQLLMLLLAIIVLASAGLYALYRRKNKLYLQIVKQHQEYIRKTHPNGIRPGAAKKYSVSSLSDTKSRELFHRLEKLMKEEHVYRQCDLTKERLAEMMVSNRTYLSQVVNEQAGTSILNYINSYRLDEAVEMLSDIANDAPLKAVAIDVGFASTTTFYKFFKNAVGMPPSKFREKVIELHRKNG